MATPTWIGNAHATRQIDTITVADTWAGNDTVTMTMNGKDLVVTVGNGTTTAQVAASIRDAWNATSRIDGTGSTTNTSNFGGQEHGEFAEAEAVIYATSDTVVRIIGRTAGRPFTLSVTESTAGSGTATEATTQAATGPHHWNNADNWDTGSVPADGDTVTFKQSNVSVWFGLPNGSLEITLIVHQSYTGMIGLYRTNTWNASKPYNEYRQRHVKLDESGGPAQRNHIIGLGEGLGSPLINLVHDTSTQLNTVTVYNTGTPQVTGTKAVNVVLDSGANGGVITVLRGSVDCGAQFGTTPTFATLNVGNLSSPTNADVSWGDQASDTAINISGGTLTINDTASPSGTRTIVMTGGRLVANSVTTSGTTTLNVSDATAVWNTSKTIGTLIIGSGGTFSLEEGTVACTLSTCDLFKGASLFDGAARGTYSAGIDLNRCGVDDVTIRVGQNRRLTLGTAA